MIAKLAYSDPPCGADCCDRKYRLQVANTGRSVCSDFAAWLCKHLGQEDVQKVEIDARRLWEEIPSPCWMLWFVFTVAADVSDTGITNEIDQLEESLDIDFGDDVIDPAKCAVVRQALPWERVEALLVRAGQRGRRRTRSRCS
jgi:hypothetical protein